MVRCCGPVNKIKPVCLTNFHESLWQPARMLCLSRLKDAAQDEDVNLMPVILEAVKAYASLGEMCGVMREVFGEYQQSVNL